MIEELVVQGCLLGIDFEYWNNWYCQRTSIPHLTLSIIVWTENEQKLKIEEFLITLAMLLTHWGRVTHICVIKLNIIDFDNGLSPGRQQAIIWSSGGILLISPLGTKFSEMLIGIQTFSFAKMNLKTSSAERRQFCLGLNAYKSTMRLTNKLTIATSSIQSYMTCAQTYLYIELRSSYLSQNYVVFCLLKIT